MASFLETVLYTSMLLTTLSSPVRAQEEVVGPLCGTVEQCTIQGTEKYRAGRFGDAITMFNEALTMNPEPEYRATLHLNLSACYKDLGEPGLAIDQLLRFLKERPEQSPILPTREKIDQSLRGLHLYEQGLQAREEERRRELKPGDTHNFGRAVHLLERAYEAASTRSSLGAVLRDLGATYELAGKYKLAAQNYEGYLREMGPKARDKDALRERIALLKTREEKFDLPPIVAPLPLAAPSFLATHKWSLLTAGGAVALGVGALVNRLGANADYQDLHERCVGNNDCSPSDADGIKTRDTITAALGIGSALALGAAGVLFYIEIPKNVPTVTAKGIEWRVEF